MGERAVEHKTEPTYIPQGDYSCIVDPQDGFYLPRNIMSREVGQMKILKSALDQVSKNCRLRNQVSGCHPNCPIALWAQQVNVYDLQNDNDAKAVED